jgi:hypothetical protein
MTVAVNQVQKDNTDAQILMGALGIAKDLYGVHMNKKQKEAADKYKTDKEAEEETKKAATELSKNQQDFDKNYLKLPAGQENSPGSQVLTRPGEAQPGAYISLDLFKDREKNANEIKKAQIAATTKEGDKKATEAEKNTALFGQRMSQANDVLLGLEKPDANLNIAGAGTSLQRSQFFPEYFKPVDLKKYEQAQRNFITAVLRKESGASISDGEMANAKAQYFPQAGDTEEVINQKQQTRALAIDGFKHGSGREWDKIAQQPAPAPQQQGGTGTAMAAPAQGGMQFKNIDPQIDAYSKQNNLNYMQARQLLINRGYKPNE